MLLSDEVFVQQGHSGALDSSLKIRETKKKEEEEGMEPIC